MAQINVAGGPSSAELLAEYLKRLSDRRINLPFLSLSHVGSADIAALCVTADEGNIAQEIAFEIPRLVPRVTVLSPVAAVSVFPHHGRLTLLGHLLAVLHREQVPLLAMGSSLASFTFTLAHRSLAHAMEVLEEALDLPENHAPLQAQLKVIQVPEGETP